MRRPVDGSRACVFAPAALKLVESGFDVIDLNFACPVKKVLGRCRGGYLLSDPTTALEIVGRVRDALPPHVPLTVKMRRGMDDSPESRDRFFAIFDGAFRWARRPPPSTAARCGNATRRQLTGFSAGSEATRGRKDRHRQRRPLHRPRLPRSVR